MATVPYTFANTPGGASIPLKELDDNFAALGNLLTANTVAIVVGQTSIRNIAVSSSFNVLVGGYYSNGDGGGGQFYAATPSAPGTYTDNGGSVIIPSVGITDGSVAWLRILDGGVSVRMFGAYGDGVHDDTVAIQNAINYADVTTGIANIPDGTFLISAPISLVGKSLGVYGAGPYDTFIKANASITSIFDIVEATNIAFPNGFVISNMRLDGNNATTNGIFVKYRHRYTISHVYIVNTSYGITATSAYGGRYESLDIAAFTVGIQLVGSNHGCTFSQVDITSFTVYGIIINNLSLGDGNLAVLFSNISIEFGLPGYTGGAVYIDAGASAINFDTCYLGEAVYGPLFTVNQGVVNVVSSFINFGCSSTANGFNITGISSWIKVEKSWIISQGQLGISGLASNVLSGSPATGGKIIFRDNFIDEQLFAGAGGDQVSTGDFLDFGPSQTVFATRYGMNYSLYQLNCTAVATPSTLTPAMTVSFSSVLASPKASLYTSLINRTESYFVYPHNKYLVVVYSSNLPVVVSVSQGAGGAGVPYTLGTMPSTGGATKTYMKFVAQFVIQYFTTLEFTVVPSSTSSTFAIQEVYLSDQTMLGHNVGDNSTSNYYKC